jgi:hypothetical protein
MALAAAIPAATIHLPLPVLAIGFLLLNERRRRREAPRQYLYAGGRAVGFTRATRRAERERAA